MTDKKILVIGAGFSGISAIKASLECDEKCDVVCYERSEDVGGIWNYNEEVNDTRICVSSMTTTNTSKEFLAFSDFMFPEESPNYMRNCLVKDYIDRYVDHFQLREKITLNRNVASVKRNLPADKSQFRVVSVDLLSGQTYDEIFDYIYVCNGLLSKENTVSFPNQEAFKGRILHSRNYRDPAEFKGQRVCVVGIGNTAVDIATELSKICKQVYLSTRSGNYILNRGGNKGLPLDLVPFRRYFQSLMNIKPNMMDSLGESFANNFFDHELYGIKPKERISQVFASIHDDLPSRIITGEIVICKDIKTYTDTGVVFRDDHQVEVDVVIYATGFRFSTSFLDTDIVGGEQDIISLYRNMLIPEVPNIAFIGYIVPMWSIPPVVEMQCRYISRVFKGDITLPSVKDMKAVVAKDMRVVRNSFTNSPRHAMRRRGFPYMESLATDIGCRPRVAYLLVTDPTLGLKVMFGMLSTAQYRLRGPNTWPGARDAIMDLWRRVETPFGADRAADRAERYARRLDRKVKIFYGLGITLSLSVVAGVVVKVWFMQRPVKLWFM